MQISWTNPWGERVTAKLTDDHLKALKLVKIEAQISDQEQASLQMSFGTLANWDLILIKDPDGAFKFENFQISGLGQAVLNAISGDHNKIDLDHHDCPLCEKIYGDDWRAWRRGEISEETAKVARGLQRVRAADKKRLERVKKARKLH